jgi:hypothetical protein
MAIGFARLLVDFEKQPIEMAGTGGRQPHLRPLVFGGAYWKGGERT